MPKQWIIQALHREYSRMQRTKQAVFVSQVENALSIDRLDSYSASASDPRWEAVARHEWNVAICEAFYPLLHHLEVVLRNRLYDLGAAAYRPQRVHHIAAWLDADPSPLTAYGVQDINKAKKKLFGVDRRTGTLLPPTRLFSAGDLVAALDFGFWTGLFNRHYFYQSARDQRLWPHGLKDVFPHAPGKLTFAAISGRLIDLRRLRNRVFHHEPVWRRANLVGDCHDILELVGWMSPEVACLLAGAERLTEVVSDEFRRCVRVRVYRESSR